MYNLGCTSVTSFVKAWGGEDFDQSSKLESSLVREALKPQALKIKQYFVFKQWLKKHGLQDAEEM